MICGVQIGNNGGKVFGSGRGIRSALVLNLIFGTLMPPSPRSRTQPMLRRDIGGDTRGRQIMPHLRQGLYWGSW